MRISDWSSDVCSSDLQPLGEFQRGLEAVGEPRLDAFAHDDAVDDDLDVMFILLVEGRRVLDLVEFSVDADAGEAFLLPLREFLAILALAAAHDGGEQLGARALGSPGERRVGKGGVSTVR